ncbi:MAG: TOBE domain-containing protein [Polaromonas sp.]|uniref:TOBE domain-containing protein n=1 Tax=Polaromonas sp. TaxID=1869339 RepID=UPI0025CBFC1B|nr:TOBE domain-containing protein [Polaromonas sp.]MBI2728748.1 TOBE domain-containing protein [Polaromonas sp.]
MPPKKIAPAALSFDSALSHEPADKRIDILRLVGESGSISQAARHAGVSYKAAWQAIDTLTNLAGVMLVERAVGGSGGGGAKITQAGMQLLSLARKLTDSRADVLAAASRGSSALATPALPYIGVRTSMRNQLPCVVEKLEVKGQVVRVFLKLAGGSVLVSRVTKASAELMGLKKGQSVLALCKATAVMVRPGSVTASTAGKQKLGGVAQRISRGASGDEVSLQLDAGLQLVGFAEAGSGIKAKAVVTAMVDESALVIALPA